MGCAHVVVCFNQPERTTEKLDEGVESTWSATITRERCCCREVVLRERIDREMAIMKNSAEREQMQARLKEQGVPSAIYYPLPLHKQPAYRDHHDGTALPVSEDLAQRILALPIHPELTDEEVARVIAAVRG